MVDNLGYSFRPEPPIDTDGSMHVVGKDSEPHDFTL
jgi:hypothetical protein